MNVAGSGLASSLGDLANSLDIGEEIDWRPEYLPASSAWFGHVPFAYWLVKVLKPRSLVELGTHWGVSYGAFCQAIERFALNTRSHAVDTWKGDPHASHYGAEVFAAIEAENEARWCHFSTLLRMTFAEARNFFGAGEVDLLHIDGYHTYDAVSDDFRIWRDTLSDRGVVLFHDTNVRRDDFGVWRFWREISAEYPHFEFVHGHGLGVLGVGKNLPPQLHMLFAASEEPRATAILRGLFAARGEAVLLRSLAEGREQAVQAAETAKHQLNGAQAELRDATERLHALQEQAKRAEDALRAGQAEVGAIRAELGASQAERRGMAARVASLQADYRSLLVQRDALINSTSWRITRPLRIAVGLLRGEAPYWALLRQRLRLNTPSALPVAFAPSPRRGTIAPVPPGLPKFSVSRRFEPVDIIVCVHNAPSDVRRCLSSILAHTLPPYRVVLVDDGSKEETRDLLADFARDHGATLIRHEQAKGYTFAANAGLRASTAPWIVLLNSDTIVTTGWLDRMWEQGRRHPQVGMIGPLSNTASWQSVPEIADGADWADNPLPEGISIEDMARIVAEASARQGLPLPFLNGFCLMLRKAMLDKIGLLDEETFGAGYGEENDLSVRARKAGWELMVAEDSFVFHAQSRSYSHERRKALCDRADAALAKKHDPATHILPQVTFCREGLAMAGIRARVAAGLEREDVIAAARARWEGRRIAFVLPVAGEGGGPSVVLQEALALRHFGVDARIVNFEHHRTGFETSYPDLGLPVHYATTETDLTRLLADPAHHFDAVVATACLSAYWLPEQGSGPVCAYYVQDYEPDFFPPSDPNHQRALYSYSFRPDIRMFTKTDWNAGMVEANAGRRPTVIGPSVNADLFRPAPDATAAGPQVLRITAMVRPSTPRRRPVETAEVLRRLAARFGGRIAISTFGAPDDELAQSGIALPGISNLGRLQPRQVAALLPDSDIFLDFSAFQAMGLTALEAMASGCAVVVPQRGGAVEFIANGDAALSVDTDNLNACVGAAARLIEDAELRRRLRLRAVAEAARYYPERAASRMLDVIFASPASSA